VLLVFDVADADLVGEEPGQHPHAEEVDVVLPLGGRAAEGGLHLQQHGGELSGPLIDDVAVAGNVQGRKGRHLLGDRQVHGDEVGLVKVGLGQGQIAPEGWPITRYA
jgi:hypothetical protein